MIREVINKQSLPSVPEKIAFLWQGIAPMAVTAAAFSLVIIEAWAAIMVIASWLEEVLERRRERDRERHRKELEAAVDNERRQWMEWNRRREAAAVAGEDFNEPPPGASEDSEETT